MERKHFLNSVVSTGLLFSTGLAYGFKKEQEEQLNRQLVQEFVGASHRDIDRVKDMLDSHPTLLNAAHDWKMGDFETGLGAASHVGHKEMVEFFLQNGAQANIFTACLFGEMAIVMSILEAFPAVLQAKGPHGFTLLHHAEKGGEEAREVKEYLESLGAIETKIPLY